MRVSLEDLLNECIDRMIQGETMEQCLAHYPEREEELRPLLQTTLSTLGASSLEVRPEFRAAARYRFQEALRARARREERRPFRLLSLSPRWATALVAILLVFFLAGGTVWASTNSLPDEPLYPVKLLTERVQLVFTFSKMEKAKLQARLAHTRIKELEALAQKGKPQAAEKAVQQLASHLDSANSTLGVQTNIELTPLPILNLEEPGVDKRAKESWDKIKELEELATVLERNLQREVEVLKRVWEQAPAPAKTALRKALEKATESYGRVIQDLRRAKVIANKNREVKFQGIIQEVNGGEWVISDRLVVIDERTHIEGTPHIGLAVEIEGLLQPDRSILAREIEIAEDNEEDRQPQEESDSEKPSGELRNGKSLDKLPANTPAGIDSLDK